MKDFLKVTYLSLSSHLGVPSTLKLDHSILQALTTWPASLPASIRDLLQVAYRSFSFSGILGHYEGAADGLLPDPIPIIKAFEADLNALEASNWMSWDLTTKMSFLGAKLHLYSYNLTAQGRNFSSPQLPDSRSSYYLSRAYTTAIRLIQTWCAATGTSPSSSSSTTTRLVTEPSFPELARSWTIFEKTSLAYGVVLLLKLTKLSPTTSHHDIPITTENAIREALTFLKSCSVLKDDHFQRLCDVVEYICHLDSRSNNNNGSLLDFSATAAPSNSEVRSRMSSNALFNVILRAKERFHRSNKYAYSNSIVPLQEEGDRDNDPELNPGLLTHPVPASLLAGNPAWSLWDLDFVDLLGGDTTNFYPTGVSRLNLTLN